jgi:hypothetical protein
VALLCKETHLLCNVAVIPSTCWWCQNNTVRQSLWKWILTPSNCSEVSKTALKAGSISPQCRSLIWRETWWWKQPHMRALFSIMCEWIRSKLLNGSSDLIWSTSW